MSWDELWRAYEQSMRVRGRSSQTLGIYRRSWRRFVAAAAEQGLREPQAVLGHHLEHYASLQFARPGLATSSTLCQLRPVLSVFRWAARQGLLLVDPCQGVELKKPARPPMPLLSVEQIEQLLEAPFHGLFVTRLRDKAILELLYGTGLRGGELVGLSLDDLDLAEATLVARSGKSRRERLLPLGEGCRGALTLYVELARPRLAAAGERALFVTRHGVRMTMPGLYHVLNGYAERLGLGALSPHALRRAFASHMLENGANLVELKLFLGHADVRSTQVYTLLRPVQLEKTFQQSHPRARRRRPPRDP